MFTGLLRSAVAVTSKGSSNSAVRELIESGVTWPAATEVDIPLYRRALAVETDEEVADISEENEHGEHSWLPRILLPKYHTE